MARRSLSEPSRHVSTKLVRACGPHRPWKLQSQSNMPGKGRGGRTSAASAPARPGRLHSAACVKAVRSCRYRAFSLWCELDGSGSNRHGRTDASESARRVLWWMRLRSSL
ncbi:uncharacterized protein [Dermacentor albipictus]|uniref:uncharacterized protein n=1 Tax=Dermacentor albipictus TaxID=60249 RepID=UPI0038FD098B